MLHKVDHPQYHPTRFKQALRPAARVKHSENIKQEWRGGAKVRKP